MDGTGLQDVRIRKRNEQNQEVDGKMGGRSKAEKNRFTKSSYSCCMSLFPFLGGNLCQ